MLYKSQQRAPNNPIHHRLDGWMFAAWKKNQLKSSRMSRDYFELREHNS